LKHKYLILFAFLLLNESLAADQMGRLFFTPEERAQLEAARARRDIRAPAIPDGESATQTRARQGPETVVYGGVVRRSDGKSTVWINGKPVTERNRITTPNEVNVLGMANDGTVSLAIPHAPRTASLRVGQRLDVQSGRIEESFARQSTAALQREAERPKSVPANSEPKATTHAAPATPDATTWPKRTLRESRLKDADPDSGAAPAEPTSRK
jgi:hypothetical protein